GRGCPWHRPYTPNERRGGIAKSAWERSRSEQRYEREPRRQSMDHRDRRDVRHLHGGARHHGRERLAAAHCRQSLGDHRRGDVGVRGRGLGVAPDARPVRGARLTDNSTWRWLFSITIRVGIAPLLMTRLYIVDPAYLRQQERRIDYWGIGMLAVGIGALQYVL